MKRLYLLSSFTVYRTTIVMVKMVGVSSRTLEMRPSLNYLVEVETG